MEGSLQKTDGPSGFLGLQERKSSRIHWGFVLLILWCTAALTFLLVGPGAIWLRSCTHPSKSLLVILFGKFRMG